MGVAGGKERVGEQGGSKMKVMRLRGREERRKEKGTMGRSEHRFVDGGKSW